MGNGELQVPVYSKQQWVESWRGGRSFFRNKITGEQFQLVWLPKVSPHANNCDLISRSLYPLPHTPRLILLAQQPHQILLLVQQYDSPVSRYFSEVLLLVDLLLRIREITLIVQSLHLKFGPFAVREPQFGLDHRGEPLGWINELKQSMQIQVPLGRYQNSEQAMIGQIIQISQKHSPVSLPMRFMQAQASSFASFIAFLTSMVAEEKSTLSKLRRAQVKSKEWQKDKSLSPRYERTSFKNVERKIPTAFFNESEQKKRNGVPKFIKEAYSKKFGLIDSLHHRKTVTIEGAEAVVRVSPEKTHDNTPSSLISRVRSLNGLHEPKKHRGSLYSNADVSLYYCETSKQSNYPSTVETGDFLTHSGESGLKKKSYERTSFWQSPSIKKMIAGEESVRHTLKTAHSFKCHELSFISTKQNKAQYSCESNVLDKLCNHMYESKYFQERDHRSVIRQTEEESYGQSRLLENETTEANYQSTREGFQLDSIRDELANIINF